MKLTGLSFLYKVMKQSSEERCKIKYKHGRVTFDVMFFIDETPFCLMFGAIGHNIIFEFKVGQGFSIDQTIPNEQYRALCDALGLTFDAGNPFKIKTFLDSFSGQIPNLLEKRKKPEPHEVAIHRSNVEESEKKYFCGFRDNTIRGEKVTPHNLCKTKNWLGQAAYWSCKNRNISSCWTANFVDKIKVPMMPWAKGE